MISLEKVNFSYAQGGVAAVSNNNLTVGENELIAVMGRNGSGKSTLARLLNELVDCKTWGLASNEYETELIRL